MSELLEKIENLPSNGRVYVDAGGRGQIRCEITTADLKELAADYRSLKGGKGKAKVTCYDPNCACGNPKARSLFSS